MTESEARSWLVSSLDVSRETIEKLERFVSFLKREALSQNLIAASTLDSVWSRHIVDSAQLLRFLPDIPKGSSWLDLGSGAGFPGLVVALLGGHRVTLVESRARRIDFLQRAVSLLDLGADIFLAGMPLERLETALYPVISARAFAPLPRLFGLASRFSTDKTIWLLPKGRNAVKEWQAVQSSWPGAFNIEPSLTDFESGILVGRLAAKGQKTQ